MPPSTPTRYELYQQILQLREILHETARALERRAASETDPEHRAALLALAMWIRRRVHEMRIGGQPGEE